MTLTLIQSQTEPADPSSLCLSPTSTVSSHSEYPRRRRALLVSTQHVTRKAEFKFGNLPDLPLSHRDAEALRDFLIDSRGYHPDDVILMMDDRRVEKHLWPIRDRILHQIDVLTRDAPEDCHIFFYFSGHALKEDSGDRACMRADGQDGGKWEFAWDRASHTQTILEIICADGKPILCHTLHDHLIAPLQGVKRSKLVVLLDCCHSETLLDLQRGNRPNSYSRKWTFGRDQLFRALAIVIVRLLALSKLCREKRPNVTRPPRRASSKWCPPESETKEVGELSVICLSACRDGQLAHDDCERELTFTKCFLDAMAGKPDITWMELRDTLKELVLDIRKKYEEVYLQNSGSENSLSHETWTQEPRYCASSHTDLSRQVSI